MKKFCLHSIPICTKRLFPYGNMESSGQVFLKGFIFINSIKEFQTYHTLNISSGGRGCLLLFCFFVFTVSLLCTSSFWYVVLMNECSIPTSPSCWPQMETLVKSPLASPVKCFQLRDKSGLYHFHLVAVNVIFLWGTFCKLWPWLFCSYCFQTCHVLHLSKSGNMS